MTVILFGDKEIYNPWSVINYIAKGCIPQAYWVNTGKNEIFRGCFKGCYGRYYRETYTLYCRVKKMWLELT